DEHVDISSTVFFCSIVSGFVKTKFYDFRPAKIFASDLECLAADVTNLEFSDNSINSLSCMHVVEHVGLGRYGDPIGYELDLVAFDELARVLNCGGQLLFVVPIGAKARLQYNAHRVYTKDQV